MSNLTIYNPTSWDEARTMSVALSESTIVPEAFQKRQANCLIALEMAVRTGFGVMQVMQSMYIVYGKPSWSAQFVAACVNSSGLYSRLKYRLTGTGDEWACVAYATDLETGIVDEGPKVDIAMAKKQGWYDKKGSKWPDMAELMLCYRAASFFGRIHCPDIIMGMYARDELGNAGRESDQPARRPAQVAPDGLEEYTRMSAPIHKLMRDPNTTYDELAGYLAQLATMRQECGVERDDVAAEIEAEIEAERVRLI